MLDRRTLAQQCGYVFYLEPGPIPGTSKAYWGPEIRIGEPQPALSVNMDALTNVEQLTFNFDKEKKTMPIVFFQEPYNFWIEQGFRIAFTTRTRYKKLTDFTR